VTNDDGGTFDGTLSQFDIKLPNPASPYPGTAIQNIGFPDEYRTPSGPPITLKINPGQYQYKRLYSSIFNLESKYAVTNNCSGTANPGGNLTCTISFNDIAPTLTVIKHVVNDNGGTASAGDFTMSVAGDAVSNPAFTGSEVGTIITLHPGAYSVTENELNGYSVLAGTNCAGSIGLGESRTCTITSDDIPPALTLIKNVINDNGGTATSTDWTLTATGPTSISGDGFVTSETTNAFSAGGYVLSESTGPSGYTSSGWTCTGDVTNTGSLISLALGQNAVCTSTSNDNP
jgi:hypothetical protein